ncbi:uncharacterized protein LOC106013517 [Aplysia californica]|uniref:Uncharacterized protein LOC106013517 n=1 Tax=Aplysia californica TaxID=6500 RepID=A0ABM1AC66_APLCA|nr:uncharacterized protein LOC106013517 [Aplysia californica]
MAGLPPVVPLKLDKGALRPAGVDIQRNSDAFRFNVVIPRAPLMVYTWDKPRWNYPGTKLYSRVPQPCLGLPFDVSKPRKGRWGETLGTRHAEEAVFLEDTWDYMKKFSRLDREERALREARADLQKRMEICLYGRPRDPPLPVLCQTNQTKRIS